MWILCLVLMLVLVAPEQSSAQSLLLVNPCCSAIDIVASQNLQHFAIDPLDLVVYQEQQDGGGIIGAAAAMLIRNTGKDWLRYKVAMAEQQGACLALVYGDQPPSSLRIGGTSLPIVYLGEKDGVFLAQSFGRYSKINLRLLLNKHVAGGTNSGGGKNAYAYSSSSGTFNYGAAVGLTCGVVFGCVLLYLVLFFAYRRCTREKGRRLVRRTRYYSAGGGGSPTALPAATAVPTATVQNKVIPTTATVVVVPQEDNAAPPSLDVLALPVPPLPLTPAPALPPPPPEPATTATDEPVFEIVIVDTEDEENRLIAAAAAADTVDIEDPAAGGTRPLAESRRKPSAACCGRAVHGLLSTSLSTMSSGTLRGAGGQVPGTPTMANAFDNGGTCTICLDDFEQAQEVFLLPCRHVFHPSCVQTWLTSHGNCPNCKQDLIQLSTYHKRHPTLARALSLAFGHPLVPTLLSTVCVTVFALTLTFTLLSVVVWRT